MWVWSLGREDPLEEEMTIHSSILAWRIPWTEEPGGLQSMGSWRVWHEWAHTHTSSVSSVVQRRASRLHTGPIHLEAERQACNSQNRKARGCCNLSPRKGIFHQTVSRLLAANHVFLRCWMVDICQEGRSLRSALQREQMAHTHTVHTHTHKIKFTYNLIHWSKL